MKFLLTALNAKYIHSNPALHSLRCYAAAHNPDAAGQVELAEYTINQQTEDILADIYKRKPDVIAFSCYIWNWSMIRELVAELHKIMPFLPIWLGGPEVSFDAEKLLEKQPFLAGIMIGEGEVTFTQLLEYYQNHRREAGYLQTASLSEIAGLVFRDPVSGEIVRTLERELTDISELPFFYEDLSRFENRILYYESSRGCPFQCSYCLSSIDKRVRLRNIELVKKELQFFLDHKVPQVKFVDRTFNCNHAHAWEIWTYILEHDNGVTNFHFEIAADLLEEEELLLLSRMRPGLVQLEIGVQSVNEKTLQAVHRYTKLSRLQETVARIQAGHNVHVHLDLIAGLPQEDFDSFRRSFDAVYRMRPQQLQLGFLKVLKGSYMEEMADSYGLVYTEQPPYEVLYTKWLSYEELLRLKQVEKMVELYYNSGQFTHLLPFLETGFESPFGMFEALADFYEEKDYFVNSPARSHRYQVLLEFAEVRNPGCLSLCRELAVYDMYLRENCKSRPAFARQPNGMQHDKTVDFYKKEEADRCYLPAYEAYNAKQLQRMTHLEFFQWPVWADVKKLRELAQSSTPDERNGLSWESDAKETEWALLFDYSSKDPLNNNARVIHVEV